ncbi:olfactory receptor 5AR1-like [Pleurodeles waltl]|uniref:olfactory receptor 5AR1-like n=1 Tax=Pleurodeles waltl TaxID=8319 RepID=UPI0037096C19
MRRENLTLVMEFHLSIFTDDPKLHVILFVLFLLVYIITVLGNACIIVLIKTASHLHTAMYFFICNLSLVDLCYSSAIVPKMLCNFLSEKRTISFFGCAAQLFWVCCCATIESLLLAVMAYDRYSAICNPLLYVVIMNKNVCTQLAVVAYLGGLIQAVIQTSYTFTLPFCMSNKISHFFCDLPPLWKLSCSDTTINQVVVFVLGSITSVGCVTIILVSYAYIISHVVRSQIRDGHWKAFSTCTSHLTCVCMFYGTILFMYFRPKSSYSLDQDKVASVFYTVVIPMINPLIYSLRNTDMKEAMKTTIRRPFCSRIPC